MPIQAPLILKKQLELAEEEKDERAVRAVRAVKVVVMLARHVRRLEGGLDHSFYV
jgi:hypothetical protein